MGWAKYAEDNRELLEGRFYQPISADRYRAETIVQVCAILPIALPIEVKVKVEPAKKQKRKDQVIKCKDCGQDFVFSGGEQDYYERKGYCTPKRCKCCRDRIKLQRLDFSMRRG